MAYQYLLYRFDPYPYKFDQKHHALELHEKYSALKLSTIVILACVATSIGLFMTIGNVLQRSMFSRKKWIKEFIKEEKKQNKSDQEIVEALVHQEHHKML
jgi:hypothetical protein